MRALLLLLVVSGCGRVAFDARGDVSDAAADVGLDAFTCPVGYTFEATTGSCYRTGPDSLPWLQAEAACEADGGHLVIIDNATEAAVVDRYRPSPTDLAWIGAQDIVAEGIYRDVTNNIASYVVFDASEPEGAAQDCLILHLNLTLGDGICTNADDYICEYDGRRGVSPAWGVCPNGYAFVQNGCYRTVLTTASTWFEGETACEADGAGHHLVVLDSATEAATVQGLVGIADYWAGGTDIVSEAVFPSVTNGPFGFITWAAGEPSGGTAKNCLLVTPVPELTVEDCGVLDDFVCEYDAIDAVPAAYGQ